MRAQRTQRQSKRGGLRSHRYRPSAISLRLAARRIAVVSHRYFGLAMTLFLVIAGLTGSLLAFTMSWTRL